MQKEPTDSLCPSCRNKYRTGHSWLSVCCWSVYLYHRAIIMCRENSSTDKSFVFLGETHSVFRMFVTDYLPAGGKKLCLGGCNTHFIVCQFTPYSSIARTLRNLCGVDHVNGFAGSGKDPSHLRKSGVHVLDCKDGPLTVNYRHPKG